MKKKYIIILLIAVIILICFFTSSFAKYAYKRAWNYYLSTKGFYFSSDKLDSSGKTNIDNQWDGNKVYFTLNNFIDNNITTNDIKYNILCTTNTGDTCYLNDTNSNEYNGVLSSSDFCVNNSNDNVDVSEYDKVNCELNGYEWVNSSSTSEQFFTIVDSINTDLEVYITVTSSEPYKQVLSGTFKLHKIDVSNNDYVLNYQVNKYNSNLVITNNSSNDSCFKISWDSNNLRLYSNYYESFKSDEGGYINEVVVKVNAMDNLNNDFFIVNKDKSYSIDDFIVDNVDCN